MGTWGVESFENDTAADWACDFKEAGDLTLVEKSLDATAEEQDYLDSDLAAEAIAACEVLARLRGHYGQQDSYTESLDLWVSKNPQSVSPDLLEKAQRAIDRILGPNSEMSELWEETDDVEDWKKSVSSLRNRLAT